MKVHLIHGIHTSQPGGTVAKLKPFFEGAGYEVVVHNYGYAHALTARFINPFRAIWLATKIEDGDVVVGHSNGCTLAWMISNKYRNNLGLVYINPALDDDAESYNSKWVNVYFNKGDEVVHWSKLLFAHPWGEMGRVGYTGLENDEVLNVDCGVTGAWAVHGHSDLFSDYNIVYWGPRIVNDVLTRGN